MIKHVPLSVLLFTLSTASLAMAQSAKVGDIAAAAHFSCLDFLDEMPWRDYPAIKDWYQKIKSRPTFRPLLGDRQPGLRPPRHYADLDF